LVPFPFSDLSASKLRPAVVLADAARGDWVLCQVTSNPYGDSRALELHAADFAQGSLHRVSFARPARLFTAQQQLITAKVAQLTDAALGKLIDGVIKVFRP
jgi:mRNA interferase MazF